MSFAFAGALMGLGDGIQKMADERRKMAQRILEQKERQAERQQERDWQLEDEQRAAARKDEIASRTSDAILDLSGNQREFVDKISPVVQRKLQERGLSLDPKLVVAQAALETGYGKHVAGGNLFGIKSHGKPGGTTQATTEYVGGRPVRVSDSFRSYDSIEASVDGYLDFLMENPRYQKLLQSGDMESQIEALANSGYATDPEYGSKIRKIASGLDLSGRDARARRALELASHPDTTAQGRVMIVSTLKANGMLGGSSQDLEGEEWVRGEDGKETLMGRVAGKGQMVPYTDTEGNPITRAADPGRPDEYQRYAQEEEAAGRTPLNRIDYAQAKKGNGFSVTTADGTTVQMGGGSGKLTEGQSKNIIYTTRAKGALETVNTHGQALTSRMDRLAEMDPTGLAREAQSEEFQLAKQAGDEFLQAVLRKDTGAAITAQEQELYGGTYLPRPGDSPALLKQKQQARQRAVIALEAGMSPQEILRLEMAMDEDRSSRGATPPPAKSPAGGGVEGGASSPAAIGSMSLDQLNALDVNSLSVEQIDAAEARYKQLQGGQR